MAKTKLSFLSRFLKKQLVIAIAILFFLGLGTVLVVLFGKGYSLGFTDGKPTLLGTGILVATSSPDGAQVKVNGHLTTATDNTINLAPGEYIIKIEKEGYFTWEKKIIIQNEVVSKAEALLLPKAPKLESITAIGVENPVLDPSQTKIAYTVASQSASALRKNGIYILDMNTRPILTLQSSSTQIADNTIDFFSQARVAWSPDGQFLLASMSASLDNPTTYLLRANTLNQAPQDVTATLLAVTDTWKKDKAEKQKALLDPLKKELKQAISDNFSISAWSPDETKILYVASQSATLPIIIKPPLIGSNLTPEERTIQKGSVYIYDIKEDKNFKLPVTDVTLPEDTVEAVATFRPTSPIQWLSESKHLLYLHDKRIDIMEYDGLNSTTVYAGPFLDSYVYSWPNASKIVVLTNLGNPSIPANLYTISLK